MCIDGATISNGLPNNLYLIADLKWETSSLASKFLLFTFEKIALQGMLLYAPFTYEAEALNNLSLNYVSNLPDLKIL